KQEASEKYSESICLMSLFCNDYCPYKSYLAVNTNIIIVAMSTVTIPTAVAVSAIIVTITINTTYTVATKYIATIATTTTIAVATNSITIIVAVATIQHSSCFTTITFTTDGANSHFNYHYYH
ncbi:hypothetical protein L9F63_006799, partial [Diploptera punctata]